MDDATIQAVIRSDTTPTLLIDPHGKVLAANPAAAALIGASPGEPLRSPDESALAALLAQCNSGADARASALHLAVRSGETRRFRVEAGALGAGIVVLRLRDPAPVDDGLVAPRAQTTDDLLRAVIATAIDGVIMIDARGRILVFHPACERLFGYRAEEVVGQNVKILMPPEFREHHDRYIDSYLRTGVKRIIGIGREVTGQRKDGTTFLMDLSVGEIRQDDEPIFVGVIHDLSARKRVEQQLVHAQKMEAIGQLSGGIAHDFNNLLTVILGSAETLHDVLKARPDLQDHAAAILRAGQRGAELTQRLLAFARRQMLRPAEIDCNALLRSLQPLLRRTLPEDIEIRTELAPDLWTAIADAGQLESAILNLALNAQDAMPEGGRLTIATANARLDESYADTYLEVRPGLYVAITVTDDGHGMSPEVRARAFEPFFTTKEFGKGSGLGLSMVYGFVKQSSGHVTLYSEPGLGTTVRLYLPAAAGSAPERPVEEEADDDAAAGGRETVLVVEDDVFVRAYAIATLTSLGYRVVSATNGPEALSLLEGGAKIDLLFTDIVMPGGMKGWELAARARRLRPALKVLLTSGYAIETLAARGHARPEMLLLNKPYRKAELARRVREALAASPPPE
jgi:PAS domain S-box-containing protein